jgi:hypothetical protein
MIVARFCSDDGKPIIARGTYRFAPYGSDGKAAGGEKDKGWFPIESFNFGFEDKTKSKKPKPGATPGKSGSPAPSQAQKKPEEEEKEDFATVSIKKTVDSTSVSLMMLVMEERETGQGARDKTPIEVDIHVISTVELKEDEISTFTSLLIHLEAVSVLSWKIDGSGDLRPSENVTLKYDRAAMIYNDLFIKNGLPQIMQYGPRGWDQKNCEQYKGEFRWDIADYKEYLPLR